MGPATLLVNLVTGGKLCRPTGEFTIRPQF